MRDAIRSGTKASRLVVGASMFAIAGSLLSVQNASAGTVSCNVFDMGANILAPKVTGTSACEVSDTNSQDFLNTNPITVNSDQFFGFDDWQIAERIAFDGDNRDDMPIGFELDGNAQAGSWMIDANTLDTFDVMLIFKGGNENSGTSLVGYLLSATMGDYSTPFVDPPFDLPGGSTNKDISHISAYKRERGGTEVPEPSALLLVSGGLLALGLVRRRRA